MILCIDGTLKVLVSKGKEKRKKNVEIFQYCNESSWYCKLLMRWVIHTESRVEIQIFFSLLHAATWSLLRLVCWNSYCIHCLYHGVMSPVDQFISKWLMTWLNFTILHLLLTILVNLLILNDMTWLNFNKLFALEYSRWYIVKRLITWLNLSELHSERCCWCINTKWLMT